MENFNDYLKLGSLSVSGFLLTHFHKMNITSDELVMILELKLFRSHGNLFPDAKRLSKCTGFSENQVYDLLHRLVEKKIVAIDKNIHGLDEYSFAPLNQKISRLVQGTETKESEKTPDEKNQHGINERKELFKQIEQEFGRPLSPMELETINAWISQDQYSPSLISLALKEAVLNQVYNLKYMDRILLNWQKQNIKTAAQVETANKKRNQNKIAGNQNSGKKGPDIPIFKIDK